MRILIVVGARPNFMKAAPLVNELRAHPDGQTFLVHTGQHYDERMSQVFFEELGLPPPDHWLGAGGATPSELIGRIMVAFEPVLSELQPDVVVVVGDVDSTVACSLVAAMRQIPVAHVEAGLRSFDRTMPEEINRVVTDSVSSVLYTPSRQAALNLQREGISEERIVFVGNVMIDTLLTFLERAEQSPILDQLNLPAGGYALVTLHRPSNVDDRATLESLVNMLEGLQERLPVLFPVHPRTGQRLQESGLITRISEMPRLTITSPLGYVDFLKALSQARAVLTDSGGIQEETTVLRVPCLTLRENTERPETITEGSNRLVGNDPMTILSVTDEVLSGRPYPFSPLPLGKGPGVRVPELWDGKAAERIVNDLLTRDWQTIRGSMKQWIG